MIYTNIEDVLYINRGVTDGRGTTLYKDGGDKIDAAIGRMQTSYGGRELFPSLYEKASALIHSIVTTHPFEDGNKRTGLITGLQFLYDNGLSYKHDVSDEELANKVIDLAANRISQKELADWIKERFERHVFENTSE